MSADEPDEPTIERWHAVPDPYRLAEMSHGLFRLYRGNTYLNSFESTREAREWIKETEG